MTKTNPTAVRRKPEQDRAQQSFNAILSAAATLIGEKGADSLSMTELAKHAGVSKPALYRYFPNKQAIFQELAKAMFSENNALLGKYLANGELSSVQKIHRMVHAYYELQKSRPYRSNLRAAISADPQLATMDLDDSRQNAAAVAAALVRIHPQLCHIDLEKRLFLLMNCIDNVGHLCSLVDGAEAKSLIDEFIQVMLLSLGLEAS